MTAQQRWSVIAVLATALLLTSSGLVWQRLGSEVTIARAGAAAPAVSPTPAPAAEAVSRSPGDLRPESTQEPEAIGPGSSARPVRLGIQAVGLDLGVRPVGVSTDGQMQLPPDPLLLGWYRYGPAPSRPGSAVLAGHLDSDRYGLGPLVRLREATVGDAVEVLAADGTRTAYRVSGVTRYPRQALPASLFARTGSPRLQIVTCGGAYDAEAGGYQANLVVTAVPVARR